MKKILFLIVCYFLPMEEMLSQASSPERIYIQGGIAFPVAPLQFYDYWQNGYGTTITRIFGFDQSYDHSLTLEYHRFLFHNDRFADRLNLSDKTIPITGAITHSVDFYWSVRYRIPGYKIFAYYCFIGLGVAYSNITEGIVEYRFSTVTKNGQQHLAAIVPVGTHIEKEFKGINWVAEAKYVIGISKDQSNNTDFTSISLGMSIALLGE